MPQVTINYLTVLGAAIASMILGALWYGPLFGKKWMAFMGWKPEEMQARKKGAGKSYLMMFIGSLVMAYVLSHFVDYTEAESWQQGMQTGFWSWLGFMVPVMAGSVLWEGKPWGLYFLNASYQLVNLLVMGAILAVWV